MAQAFRRRWGVVDATWAINQRFHRVQFLVGSWRSIRRLVCLVVLAFFWLNLWGEDRYELLRAAFLSYPSPLRKEVSHLVDWLAWQISRFLYPSPKTVHLGYFDAW